MSDKLTLMDLLAYRDGEPVDASTEQQVSDDPQLAAQLQQLVSIKAELRALPDVAATPEMSGPLKAALQARMQSGPVDTAATDAEPGWFKRTFAGAPGHSTWRLATAASVFMAALLGSALWLPNLTSTDPTAGAGTHLALPNTDNLAHLVGRSQQLEQAVQSQVTVAGAQPSSSQRALMFRIADLDAELNSLQQESMHPELKERLWQQRVELLETLMEIQRFQMQERADF